MLCIPHPALIQRRYALTFEVMKLNVSFTKQYADIRNLRDILEERIGNELFNLGFYSNESSDTYDEILEYLQVLNDRFCNDMRKCLHNFRANLKWLTENVHEFDAAHTYLWCTLMDQVNEHSQLLDRIFKRFMNVTKMVYDVMDVGNNLPLA